MEAEYSELFSEIANSVATVYKWPDFYKPVYKKEVAVPQSTWQRYEGIYAYDNSWSSVLTKDGAPYFFSDGIPARIHFLTDTSFFNMEFMSEKQFVRDAEGRVTGYTRTLEDKVLAPASRILNPDTLHLDKDQLNAIGWHLLENKRPADALPYLEHALQSAPGDLILLGNLAHAYLFTDQYSKAVEIYRAHLAETVTKDMSWQDMIRQDFTFFKRAGMDAARMDRVFAALGIEKPAGY
jgi:predicted Zn-dependent protease